MRIDFPPLAVSASVSCMDLGFMKHDIERVEASETAFFHYDVVDGKFNHCYILGDAMFQYIKKHSNLPVEVHLGVVEPEPYIDVFAAYGADYIAVHYESLKDPWKVFEQIKAKGSVPVLAYRAETAPGEDFVELAEACAWVLKLTVNPGFAGQKIQPAAVEHIRQMHAMLQKKNSSVRIQADGNVNCQTVKMLKDAGATIFTGGTSGLFLKEQSVQENLKKLLAAATV
ncbi:ribulose-phosphate 3-epimerase [Anaerosinus massiliensis]|uniref:ribulose-phosphate 3-epimerase n=1 Tax=Massilibacillus massiliensis TaxID=1806837 RepID=UPI000A86D2EB|nr:ribulose-phosphate 3-epimerase [Massilibacillus massiliensis]